jgi:hypothetical protein
MTTLGAPSMHEHDMHATFIEPDRMGWVAE